MKIGIDISQIVYETGVSTYTKNLVENLLKIDKKNEYVLYAGSLRRQKDVKNFLNSLSGNYKSKLYPIPPTIADILWNKLHVISVEKLIGEIDVFHSSDWSEPPSKAFKVTTIHDLTPLKFPKETPYRLVEVHKRKLYRVAEEVDRVIVPSESTKKDVVEIGIDENSIRVVHEAPSLIFKPATSSKINELKRKYRIGSKYLLAVGTKKRKNLERIVKAYENIKGDIGFDHLVIIGETSHNTKEDRGVIFTGHVEESELPIFYSGAEALVYTSLYEGFGLPILEAFACKTPVVTSIVSSMPEVASKAAVLVDPRDTNAISDGIINAIKNKNNFIAKGTKRVKRFSWKKTAEATLKVYNELIN